MKCEDEVIPALQAFVEKHICWGFLMYFQRLRIVGYAWNHKRVYYVYVPLGLNRDVKRRSGCQRIQQLPDVPAVPNAVCSIDFMHDTVYVELRFRTIGVVDDGIQEIEIDISLSSERIVRVLDRLKEWGGTP
ncbi:MAG: hypothetical protein GY835_07980 [bacterium]|nr:hypothetical protein [bacterium]